MGLVQTCGLAARVEGIIEAAWPTQRGVPALTIRPILDETGDTLRHMSYPKSQVCGGLASCKLQMLEGCESVNFKNTYASVYLSINIK